MKKIICYLATLILMSFLYILISSLTISLANKKNISYENIKNLAIKYAPIIVFDPRTTFFPLRFDELPRIVMETPRKKQKAITLNPYIISHIENVDSPFELFRFLGATHNIKEKDATFYIESLSIYPEKWLSERTKTNLPDYLPIYVNTIFIEKQLKIIYTLAIEANHWHNYHRGDGALFSIHFEEKNSGFEPIFVRTYLHQKYIQYRAEENMIELPNGRKSFIFFVAQGSHSTFGRPGLYKNVDSIPIIQLSEEILPGECFSQRDLNLIFIDETRSKLESWVFLGYIYWGGSPNDRIYSKNSFIGKIPLVRKIAIGNRSYNMSKDPSAPFKQRYKIKGIIYPFDLSNCIKSLE